ncbi:MAG: hypothetical protein Q4G67_13135 [Actinomycetia bacterium]|nr:hypothetical protein [Actinomycetes bacterium]
MSEKRRRRRAAKVSPGDGSTLKPMRAWEILYRTLFVLDAREGRSHEYAVDVDLLDVRERVHLFTDGVQSAVASAPAAFPVEGGTIEVELTMFGLRRVHFVPDAPAGSGVAESAVARTAEPGEQVLRPARGTAEHARARLDRRFPTLSRIIGWLAVAVLLIGLFFVAPTALELVTSIPWVANVIGTPALPWSLPDGAAGPLAVAGVVAALERALTLRNHWLIDADTWWLGD